MTETSMANKSRGEARQGAESGGVVRSEPANMEALKQDFRRALDTISQVGISLEKDPFVRDTLMPRYTLLTQGSAIHVAGERFFKIVAWPGGNNYAISAVAQGLVCTEIAAAILEIQGGYDVQVKFLRENAQKIREAIKGAMNHLDPEVLQLLKVAAQEALGSYIDNPSRFSETTKGIVGHEGEKQKFKDRLATVRFDPADFFEFGLGSLRS